MQTLNNLEINEGGEIMAIKEDTLKAHLIDMGLYPGKTVKLLFKAPLGDPIAIDVEGYTLSLRLAEAALVQIRLETDRKTA